MMKSRAARADGPSGCLAAYVFATDVHISASGLRYSRAAASACCWLMATLKPPRAVRAPCASVRVSDSIASAAERRRALRSRASECFASGGRRVPPGRRRH